MVGVLYGVTNCWVNGDECWSGGNEWRGDLVVPCNVDGVAFEVDLRGVLKLGVA